jgi:hypothetical protein
MAPMRGFVLVCLFSILWTQCCGQMILSQALASAENGGAKLVVHAPGSSHHIFPLKTHCS